MNTAMRILLIVFLGAGSAGAETGFDSRYERDYNIFNPATQYQTDNPFNQVNQYHPDNPLNPANKYNPDVPFAPLDGGSGRQKTR